MLISCDLDFIVGFAFGIIASVIVIIMYNQEKGEKLK
jgi:hypothetical protein